MIYPNPVSHELFIFDETLRYSVWQITDATGRTIMKGNLTGSDTRINTNELAAGLYEVILRGDAGIRAFKLQKL